MNERSDTSRTPASRHWREHTRQEIKPRAVIRDQDVAGGLAIKEDFSATREWRGSENPPARDWTTLQSDRDIHHRFAALADGPADPDLFGKFASQHGLLVFGQERSFRFGESYVLWRWHAERLRFLILMGEARRLWNIQSYPESLDILASLRAETEAPPMLDVWTYGSSFPWIKEEHEMDRDEPLAPGGLFLRVEASMGCFDAGPPLGPDMERVHHPFHEDLEFATLPYLELRPEGGIEIVGAGGRYLAARSGGKEPFPTRGATAEVREAMALAFRKVFRSAFEQYWSIQIVGGSQMRLDVGPGCVLGLIYEALFNDLNRKAIRAVRRCLHCGEAMQGAAPQRRYHDRCQKPAQRARRAVEGRPAAS